MSTASADGMAPVRLAKDPRDNTLYYLKLNGDVYRLINQPGQGTSSSSTAYTSGDHGISANAQGMAIGPDGTMYLVGNTTTNNGNSTFAQIVKGVPGPNGVRAWSLLAQTEMYPRSRTAFDHLVNAIIVSPDGAYVYVNSGARTDHGEEQNTGGLFPNTREVPLTAKIFRLPAAGSNLFLPNDLNALRSAGYVFAEGTRNAFDFAFAPGGELFATDNGPDRDMSDELNWLRQGKHYGFPWRMGGTDNPQQFPDYNPANDLLLDPRFIGVYYGYYHNDPAFPAPPTNFVDPVINLGPDAAEFRDPADGSIKNAAALDLALSTFTAHRSPLGLVFDVVGAIAPPYQKHGLMLSFTPGDPTGNTMAGPFYDPGQDLVDLALEKLGETNFQVHVTRVVGGFSTPVDAEIIGNKVYVLEYSGGQGLWEIRFPPAPAQTRLGAPLLLGQGTFQFTVEGLIPGQDYLLQRSANLVDWVTVTSFVPINQSAHFTEAASGQYSQQFYRVAQSL